MHLPETVSCSAIELCLKTDIKEALRYSGCRDDSDLHLRELMKDCLNELRDVISPKAAYLRLKVAGDGADYDLGFVRFHSESLRTFLGERDEVYVFAATLGVGADRLISRYSLTEPSRAVLIDAAASALIEQFCDKLCREVFTVRENERFSPGYGDLPLFIQRDIISVLGAENSLCVSVLDSLLLTPTKSVTALVRVEKNNATELCL